MALFTKRHIQGSCGRRPAWHPGRGELVEFDFYAQISLTLFRRYLPLLVERTHYADHEIYHLGDPVTLAIMSCC